ncbi:hypothetical protein DM02DRAFT_607938 [Periconia macrospinosa]|uniref:Uncharacterized protein n=1 Tax=Periconia macrospinosa TaxID=97972 RepID=A0A2V1EDD6_9PLEO|nr:hypothetical protein DM02DRAFT_607938 [Periconia macrospinosa]
MSGDIYLATETRRLVASLSRVKQSSDSTINAYRAAGLGCLRRMMRHTAVTPRTNQPFNRQGVGRLVSDKVTRPCVRMNGDTPSVAAIVFQYRDMCMRNICIRSVMTGNAFTAETLERITGVVFPARHHPLQTKLFFSSIRYHVDNNRLP